jgi:hypothetical protein
MLQFRGEARTFSCIHGEFFWYDQDKIVPLQKTSSIEFIERGNEPMSLRRVLIGMVLISMICGLSPMTTFGGDLPVSTVSRVEVVLAYQYRTREAELKDEFAQAGLANVHFQFARMGQPPQNIGLGRDVPADMAREAIRLALKYNLGIGILLPERLFPPRFITIASSNYDDTVEYPINQESLSGLQDPALSTEEFHRLYRGLTSAVINPKGRY